MAHTQELPCEVVQLAKRCLAGEEITMTRQIAELLLRLAGEDSGEAPEAWEVQDSTVSLEREDMDIRGDILVKYKGNAPEGVIPEGIRIIGSDAFERNMQLVSVHLPDQLRIIGEGAFSGYKYMKKVIAPKYLAHIEKRAFVNCYLLESIQNLGYLEYEGEEAYDHCYSFKRYLEYRKRGWN